MAASKLGFMAGMDGVKKIIAVSSCKGGVGKSMVSVNLAFSLAKRLASGAIGKSASLTAGGPARVGLFDADLYGPSLPTMVGLPPGETRLMAAAGKGGLIRAPEFLGVKLMSYGYTPGAYQEQQGAQVMRGPRASAMVGNLLQQTDWGDLDVLVVDMPPGTGDIPLTLCQELALTAVRSSPVLPPSLAPSAADPRAPDVRRRSW